MPTDHKPVNLPTIVRYDHMTRGDSMQEFCPHCGARGTVIHHFTCNDGTHRGAMSGCIKLFDWSFLALEHRKLAEKVADRARKGWKLNKLEQRMLDTILDYYAGNIDEATAEATVRSDKASLDAWRQRKYSTRRF